MLIHCQALKNSVHRNDVLELEEMFDILRKAVRDGIPSKHERIFTFIFSTLFLHITTVEGVLKNSRNKFVLGVEVQMIAMSGTP